MTNKLFKFDIDTDPMSSLKGYLNKANDTNFLRTIEYIADKNGFGFDASYVSEFEPHSEDDTDKPFEGIRIRSIFYGREETLDLYPFATALPIALEAMVEYAERHPADQPKVDALIDKLKRNWR